MSTNKTSEEVCHFLIERRVCGAVVQRFRENKVDGTCVSLMKDEQFHSFGLTALGDIVLLRAYCKGAESSDEDTCKQFEPSSRKRRTALLKRLVMESRECATGSSSAQGSDSKKKKKSILQRSQSESPTREPTRERYVGRPRFTFRSVSIGLRMATIWRGKPFKQIKAPLGDKNTVILDVEYNSTYEELLNKITEFLFPEGQNKHLGEKSNYTMSLVNADNDEIKPDFVNITLREYMAKKGLRGIVRMHLLCDDESLPDIRENIDQHQPDTDSRRNHPHTSTPTRTEVRQSPATPDVTSPIRHATTTPATLPSPICQSPLIDFIENFDFGMACFHPTEEQHPSTSQTSFAGSNLQEISDTSSLAAANDQLLDPSQHQNCSTPVSSVTSSNVTLVQEQSHDERDREETCMSNGQSCVVREITQPVQPESSDSTNLSSAGNSTQVLLNFLRQKVVDDRPNIVNVVRGNVLDGGFRAFKRKNFKPEAKLSVRFVGEDGIDDGGLRREFSTLALREIQQLPIFSSTGSLILHSQALEDNVYFKVGQMLAYLAVHNSGCGTQILSPLLYAMISGREIKPDITDITDNVLREVVHKLSDAETESQFDDSCSESWEWIMIAACAPLARYDRKDKLIQNLCKFIVCDRLRTALDQFMRGLECLSVLGCIQSQPTGMEPVFLRKETEKFTAESFRQIFDVTFGIPGSNRRREEERVVAFWNDFLLDVEEGDTPCTFGDILQFITGYRTTPLLGFAPQPAVRFNHPADLDTNRKHLAGHFRVDTCAMQIRLPLLQQYDTFESLLLATIAQQRTFTAA